MSTAPPFNARLAFVLGHGTSFYKRSSFFLQRVLNSSVTVFGDSLSHAVFPITGTRKACEKGGEWQMALYLLGEMPAAKVAPDVGSMSSSISACEKGGQWQLALHLLSQMPDFQLLPDEISYNSSISACEKGNEWQMALTLFARMPTAGLIVDEISFSGGISACEKVGKWRTALLLLSLGLHWKLSFLIAPSVKDRTSSLYRASNSRRSSYWPMKFYLCSSSWVREGMIPIRMFIISQV